MTNTELIADIFQEFKKEYPEAKLVPLVDDEIRGNPVGEIEWASNVFFILVYDYTTGIAFHINYRDGIKERLVVRVAEKKLTANNGTIEDYSSPALVKLIQKLTTEDSH
jgi:hypothetical protein